MPTTKSSTWTTVSRSYFEGVFLKSCKQNRQYKETRDSLAQWNEQIKDHLD
jgi:hypothetical protein